MVAEGPDTVGVSWGPPPREVHNGIIIAYTLTCQPAELLTEAALSANYSASAGNYSLLSGFSPATTYNCSVFATTAGGNGPSAHQAVTLLDDGKNIFIIDSIIIS